MTIRETTQIKLLALALVLGILGACAPKMNSISSRPLGMFDKEGKSRLWVHGRPAEEGVGAKPDIFVRKKTFKIKPIEDENQTGSLFKTDDGRNYLFSTHAPLSVGKYVVVQVKANRTADKPADANAAGAAAADAEDQDEVVKELLESLPDLAPADPASITGISKLTMKVTHRYENGDVLATVSRSSQTGDEGSEINVQARIPYDKLQSGEAITTADLADVRFIESSNGQLIDRRSTGWEDEYTLRFSGFDEAKSRLAMDLDEKRRKLLEARENLSTRINTFADERRNVARQRQDYLAKKEATTEKIGELEDKILEQDAIIKDQENRIKELNPEDKPGDEKDGSDG